MARCTHADDARERIDACGKIIGSTDEHRTLIRALNARGNALCGIADRCGEAVSDFAAVVKMAPTIAGYFDNYARALRSARRYDEAIAASDQAVRLAPRLAFTYAGKAHTQEEEGRTDDALATVNLALEALPADAGLWEYKGKLLGKLKRFAEAYPAFERALALQPDRSGIYIERADAELADGRHEAAIADLSRYPADGKNADAVRGKLQILKTFYDSTAKRVEDDKAIANRPAPNPILTPQAALPASVTKAPAPIISSALPTTCNFYDWTPIERCVQEYHTENDPLPSGSPNPRMWNKELFAEGKAFIAKHGNVSWDHTEWNAIAAAEADDSEQAESHYHEMASNRTDQRAPDRSDSAPTSLTSDTSSPDREVDKCNSARVLDVMLRNLVDYKNAVKSAFKDAKAGSQATGIVAVTDKLDLSIHNIRQSSYDTTNNIRNCAADFVYNFQLPFAAALVTAELPQSKALCAGPVTYKIETTLDEPGGIYVTHYCK